MKIRHVCKVIKEPGSRAILPGWGALSATSEASLVKSVCRQLLCICVSTKQSAAFLQAKWGMTPLLEPRALQLQSGDSLGPPSQGSQAEAFLLSFSEDTLIPSCRPSLAASMAFWLLLGNAVVILGSEPSQDRMPPFRVTRSTQAAAVRTSGWWSLIVVFSLPANSTACKGAGQTHAANGHGV